MAFRFLSIIPLRRILAPFIVFTLLKLNLETFLEIGEGFGLNILLEKLSECQLFCSNGDRIHLYWSLLFETSQQIYIVTEIQGAPPKWNQGKNFKSRS